MEDHKNRRAARMAMMCAMMQGSAGMMGDSEFLLLILKLHKKSESYTRLAHVMSNSVDVMRVTHLLVLPVVNS